MSSKSYQVTNVPQDVTNFIITHVRVVAHTMGPVAPGARLSQNHWSLYLLHREGLVRLNMQLRDASSNSTRGLLTVTSYSYITISNSAVRSWEFEGTSNLIVYYLLQAIIDNGRLDYDMTEGGVGCRHWISVVMADWNSLNYVATVSTDGATMESIIHYNYSIGMDPVYLEVKQGTFLQNNQTYPAPNASSSSAYTVACSTPAAYSYSAPEASSSSAYSNPQSTLNTTTLDDKDYVHVTLVKSGRDISSNVYRFRTGAGNVEKRGDQFYETTHQSGRSCMVYYGVNSQRYYWTWSL